MKARIALGMAMSFALGALAVQALHAQVKPPVYYIAEVDVTDLEGYVKEFAPKAATSAEAQRRPHPRGQSEGYRD